MAYFHLFRYIPAYMPRAKSEKQKLSIVVPTYKAAKIITKSIKNLHSVVKNLHYPFEIIVVIDGRLDKSEQILKKLRLSNVKIVGYEQNRGKGNAVRYGLAKTKGDIVGFVDCGDDLDYQ